MNRPSSTKDRSGTKPDQRSRSNLCCASSFLALVLGWIIVGISGVPLGPASHSGAIGTLTALVSGTTGFIAYVTCPQEPRLQRYTALMFAALNAWLACDTTLRYIHFGG